MSVMTWQRPAKCKDCINLRYFYRGKQKRHACALKIKIVSPNDIYRECFDDESFKMSHNYYPDRLEDIYFEDIIKQI
jgi:hypothetical protein